MATPRKRRTAVARHTPGSRSVSDPDSTEAGLDEALGFMRLLWELDHGLRSVSKQMQSRLGITAPQRLALRFIGSSPQITPSRLAQLLHLDRGTLTGIIERLLERGLVIREPDPDDGRSVRLQLSARGRKLERNMQGTVEECVARALGSLPPARVAAARHVLEALVRELDAQRSG